MSKGGGGVNKCNSRTGNKELLFHVAAILQPQFYQVQILEQKR